MSRPSSTCEWYSQKAVLPSPGIGPARSGTYVWQVPERAGPMPGEGSTAFWVDHSHVDEGRDINTGLMGRDHDAVAHGPTRRLSN